MISSNGDIRFHGRQTGSWLMLIILPLISSVLSHSPSPPPHTTCTSRPALTSLNTHTALHLDPATLPKSPITPPEQTPSTSRHHGGPRQRRCRETAHNHPYERRPPRLPDPLPGVLRTSVCLCCAQRQAQGYHVRFYDNCV